MFILSRSDFDAVIFDLDGVITQSAKIHAKAWKETFEAFLEEESYENTSFSIQKDYFDYIDGKPRYDGIESFLASRKISLPYGSPEDPPEAKTICGLGNQKNRLFLKYLKDEGVEVYEDSLDFVRKLKSHGFKIGLVTSSKNCAEILRSANISKLFDTQIDGIVSEKLHLKGKPHPDIFLKAADLLNVKPKRTVIFEDSQSGVKAGNRGNFGYVIGVNRAHHLSELKKAGADLVVSNLNEIEVSA